MDDGLAIDMDHGHSVVKHVDDDRGQEHERERVQTQAQRMDEILVQEVQLQHNLKLVIHRHVL